jgi:hypothetical protein
MMRRITHNTWTIQVAQEIKLRLTLTIGKRQVRSFAMFGIDGEDRGNEGSTACLASRVKRKGLISRGGGLGQEWTTGNGNVREKENLLEKSLSKD